MPPVSAVLIARNEAPRIGVAVRLLRGVVDEVLVLDGGSSDGTPDLARGAGARVLTHPFDGFVAQKQRAMDAARHHWVLSMDADEELDTVLRGEVERFRALGEDEISGWEGFALRRRNFLEGVPLRASGWYPDLRVRLVRRDRAKWVGAEPHDRLEIQGPVRHLRGHILHDRGRSRFRYLRGTLRHARRGADALRGRGNRPGPWAPVLHGAAHWLRKVLLGRAWRDGRRGFMVAWVGAIGCARKYQWAREGFVPSAPSGPRS